ncbi:adenine permease PurP [Raoultella terrigena]|uniref:Adenine permease PurP n=1 Tax=Raoultella terrigena TaxID=577 RepID=A0A7Z8ZH01_RAOTE|nr:adenine permease PurP [Raoultella terrigena]
MGAIFWGAVGLLLLTIFRVRYWMIANIPMSLRVGITSGIGLFIGMMGLKNAGVIVANKDTLVSIGNLTSHSVLLGILGFFIIAFWRRVTSTRRSWFLSGDNAAGLDAGRCSLHRHCSAPPSVMTVVGHVDLAGSFNLGLAGVIFSFMLVNLFDSSGTLIGVTDKAGLADEKGKFPRMKQALFVDSVSSVAGSFIGTSSVTAYIESSSGVSVGGRTGLTAVVVGILFLLVIFLSPLAGMVPAYAAAGALIYVGVLMTSSLSRVKWDDLTEAVPAFITAVMMPFSFSITEGIALAYLLLRDEDWHRPPARPQPVRDYRITAVRAENCVYRRPLICPHSTLSQQGEGYHLGFNALNIVAKGAQLPAEMIERALIDHFSRLRIDLVLNNPTHKLRLVHHHRVEEHQNLPQVILAARAADSAHRAGLDQYRLP